MNTVAVVDYGMGNLRSVAKAIEHVAVDAKVIVTSNPAEVAAASRVVVPGQGAMPDCMHELGSRGLRDAVIRAAAEKPFLGICIGLQMLFDHSEEGNVPGLGLIQGSVRRFDLAHPLKVPHMGWNTVHQAMAHPLWKNIDNDSRFYFVHSYYVEPALPDVIASSTNYGILFTSAIARDNLFATQFHPEKSAQSGLTLLENFMRWNP
ncbi:MAG: imidazole glycerol phosphate synthase subunit HisH [Rhodocyclaceae bacterium]|nr:imidazole glycerol phosphate synthase subunit HisH [Rhodocyclaceae bacterium]